MEARPKYMLDTNICIYIQRRKPSEVLQRFQTLWRGEAVISSITWGELQYGAAKSREPKRTGELLDEFSELVPILQLSPECGKHYGSIRADLERSGQCIGNNDLWIAAHAMSENLTLVTNNAKEFGRIPHLRIENWV